MQPEHDTSIWDPEARAGYWLNQASRSLLRVLESRLRPFGFGMSHLPVLTALEGGGALSQKELARAARVEQPTMAEMLGRMVRDGVVDREPNPDDKRATLISLSRRSRARLPKAKVALNEGERDAMAGLTAEERVVLRELLKKVVKTLDAMEAKESGESG